MSNESNEAYIKAVKCWLRKQDIEKRRHIQDIKMTKEQMILDDEVTRLEIIDFNAWAKENGAESIQLRDVTIDDNNCIRVDTTQSGTNRLAEIIMDNCINTRVRIDGRRYVCGSGTMRALSE